MTNFFEPIANGDLVLSPNGHEFIRLTGTGVIKINGIIERDPSTIGAAILAFAQWHGFNTKVADVRLCSDCLKTYKHSERTT